jgi:hypothetical protein
MGKMQAVGVWCSGVKEDEIEREEVGWMCCGTRRTTRPSRYRFTMLRALLQVRLVRARPEPQPWKLANYDLQPALPLQARTVCAEV